MRTWQQSITDNSLFHSALGAVSRETSAWAEPPAVQLLPLLQASCSARFGVLGTPRSEIADLGNHEPRPLRGAITEGQAARSKRERSRVDESDANDGELNVVSS